MGTSPNGGITGTGVRIVKEEGKREEYEWVEAELVDEYLAPERLKKAGDFYEKIRDWITRWVEEKGGEKGRRLAEILLLAPDLFMLLVRLVQDPRTPAQLKMSLGLGVAYFFIPLDFIPEALFGPVGFVDDAVLAVHIIHQVLNTDRALVLENWSGRGDLLSALQHIAAQAEDLVGRRVYQQIRRLFQSRQV